MPKIKVERPAPQKLQELGVSRWPVWEKEVSRFDWYYDTQEVCYFLEGKVVAEEEGGEKVEMGKGDLVTFPQGLECVWDIKKAVKKHYNFG